MKLRGRWGTVADATWTMEDAEVVCQQLGCGSAAGAYHGSKFGPAEGPISLAVVNCRGNESALWDCAIEGWGPYDGHHDHDTAVVCQGEGAGGRPRRGARRRAADRPAPPAGFSRLVGGDGACEGRLEVRRGRAWLGVCHGRVDAGSARVLCRELGCGAVLALPEPGRFGAASGPFWDGAFECDGSEPLLAACAARPTPEQRCSDSAAVVCSRKRGAGSPQPAARGRTSPPSLFLSFSQPTPGSDWRTAARPAPGGWRRRSGERGERCAPGPWSCPTPTSSADTWAAARPPPFSRGGVSGRGRDR